MPALLHIGISTTSGALGLNAFNHPWTFQVGYMFPPSALVPLVLSKFLAEHVKGQLRQLILVAPCWMEAPWLPTVLNMLADIPQWCPFIKDLIIGCLGRPGAQGSAISAFNPLAAQGCVLCRQVVLFLSLSGSGGGNLSIYGQRSTSSVGRNGQVGVLNRVYQTMPSLALN